MAEEEQISLSGIASDVESKVRAALISRVPYFREQADSLTFEGVRRVLEKDLGLETHALDAHKRFVRNCLQECLEAGTDDQVSKNSADAMQKVVSSTEGEESESVEGLQPKKEAKESNIGDGEAMEDSPVFGLMTGDKNAKNESKGSQHNEFNAVPNEVMIKTAIKKRASYLKENSEDISLAGVRRLLEEDLKLEKYALDAFKKFVTEQVNEVLTSPEISKKPTSVKRANIKKTNTNTSVKRAKSRKEEFSGQSGSDSDEVGEDDVKSTKKTTRKRKVQNSEGPKKRKKVEEDTKESGRKQTKGSKTKSEENSDEDDGGAFSEEEKSESSAEKPVKKKEAPKPLYGKRVEHLKSVIKSCGMSIPPSVYKKVKQAPENKREASLINELEEILSKEGLSTDPTEKEIKEVKKRKQRAKELEGIDLSNIVTSSRRRSTTSFAPPPKPKIPVDSDTESSDNDDDEEGGGDDDEEEEQVNKEDGGEDGQSEEEDEDNDDDSD